MTNKSNLSRITFHLSTFLKLNDEENQPIGNNSIQFFHNFEHVPSWSIFHNKKLSRVRMSNTVPYNVLDTRT